MKAFAKHTTKRKDTMCKNYINNAGCHTLNGYTIKKKKRRDTKMETHNSSIFQKSSNNVGSDTLTYNDRCLKETETKTDKQKEAIKVIREKTERRHHTKADKRKHLQKKVVTTSALILKTKNTQTQNTQTLYKIQKHNVKQK